MLREIFPSTTLHLYFCVRVPYCCVCVAKQEKDKLSQQLQKTNDEIEAVLVKINTQRRLLDMGRKAYEGCLESRAKAWRAAAKEKVRTDVLGEQEIIRGKWNDDQGVR